MSPGVLASHKIGPDGAPEVWVLHGILGSGRNWRAFTRRLARERTDLAFRLLDLRRHGDSHEGFTPPDTVGACVDDLIATAHALQVHPVGVVGHSFGGKVALAHAGRSPVGLRQTWVLDATPGPVGDRMADNEVVRVIRALDTIPLPVPDHATLASTLRDAGFSDGLAGWMTTNLRASADSEGNGEGYRWRFDLDGVRALITDYRDLDLWPVLEAGPGDLHVVRAGRGDRWSDQDVARLAASGVQDHLLADSGHWVHVDAPDALRRLLIDHLPGGSDTA